jgi:type 1 fimbria pilin
VLSQTDVAVTQNVDVNFGQLAMYTITAKAPTGATKVRVQSSTTCNTMKLDAFCLRVSGNAFAIAKSVPVQIDEPLQKEFGVMVSPNPVVGLFNLAVSSTDNLSPVHIRILSVNGKILVIQKTAANSTLKIDAATWASGIYFAEVMQNGQRKVVKLIKQ